MGLNVFKRKFYDSNLCILWKVEIYAAATTNQNQNGHFAKSFFAVQWRIPFVTPPPVEVSSWSREARIYGWRSPMEDDQTKSNRIYFLFDLFPTVLGKCQIKRVSSPKNSEEIETDDI